jgi:GT2 family glycosyltransferase
VDSVLAQTHCEVEVIVVDDGSTDDTRGLVERRYGRDRRVRYVFQANGGVSSARNHGIRLVRGAFAALLDSDDAFEPHKLELQLAVLRAFPDAGMVWTDMKAVDTNGGVIAERHLRRFYSAYKWFSTHDLFDRSAPLAEVAPSLAHVVGDARAYAGDLYAPMIMGNLVHTSTVLLRRERLDATGLFDESCRSGEDHEFHLRTCRAGRVAFADVATIDYHVGHPDQLTQPQYGLVMAEKFLRTVTGELEKNQHRIDLPRHMIDAALADAHRWVGEQQLAAGNRRGGFTHLVSSLRYEPVQPRVVKLSMSALLPRRARDRIARAYRRVKRGMR